MAFFVGQQLARAFLFTTLPNTRTNSCLSERRTLSQLFKSNDVHWSGESATISHALVARAFAACLQKVAAAAVGSRLAAKNRQPAVLRLRLFVSA